MPRNPRAKGVVGAVGLALALVLSACGGNTSQTPGETSTSDYPTKDLEWLVPYGPTSGANNMVRAIIDILESENLYPKNMVVKNVVGGGGSTGYSELFTRAGDPYVISPTVGSTITIPLQSETVWDITKFTPVALMGRDDYMLIVKGDSPYQTLDDFIEMARDHDGPVPIGGTNKVSASFIFGQLLADQAGFEMTYVPFDESGMLTTGLLSGSIPAIITNPGELAGQLESGEVRGLAFGGPERLDAFPDVPTVGELGYEIDAYNPRGIVLAPEVGAEVQEFWVETMTKVAETAAWQKYLEDNFVTSEQAFGDDFGTKVEELKTNYERVFKEAGVI